MNKLIYALFLGLYLLNINPPGWVLWYVRKFRPSINDRNFHILLVCLVNAPDLFDPALKPLVLAIIASSRKE